MTLQTAFIAALVVWSCGSVALLWIFRVFLPAELRLGPPRTSSLSLVVVGGVILFYIAIESAVALGAIHMGWLRPSDLGVAVQPATALDTQPATSRAATSPDAATAPASAPAPGPDARQIVATNAVGVVSEVLTVLLVAMAVGPMFKKRYRGWGLHPSQIPAGVVKGLLAFVIIYPLLMLMLMGLGWLYTHFQHPVTEHTTFEALDQHLERKAQFILLVMATVVAPVAEEFFFRGLLQTALIQYGWGVVIPQLMPRERMPLAYRPGVLQRCVAILITSLLFARLHPLDHAPVILTLSFALGYVYERTGILWAPMVLHAAFNSAEVGLYLLGR